MAFWPGCKPTLPFYIWRAPQVRLTNGCRVRVHVFVVYDDPREVELDQARPGGGERQTAFRWPAVSRAQCKKGCQVHCCCAVACLLCWPKGVAQAVPMLLSMLMVLLRRSAL